MVQSGTAPIVLILRDCIYLYENVRIFPIYYVLIHTIEICNHKEKRRALGKASKAWHVAFANCDFSRSSIYRGRSLRGLNVELSGAIRVHVGH